jgi:hypothetical protein
MDSSDIDCGNTLATAAGSANAGDCNVACAGNATELCGGGNRLNLFWNHQTPPPPPVTNPGVGGWTSLGCYS